MAKPDLTDLEIEYASKALREGEIGVKSHYVREFEERLADYTGFKYAVATSSGWGALLLASRVAREIGYRTIAVPSFTMIASGTAAMQAGLNPYFFDVNERGLLEGDYKGAVMPVDMYGTMSKARGQFVIEDAAEIFGKHPYYGNIVCFSFFYNKILTEGNGGACVTNDENLYKEMVLFRHHYYDGGSYFHEKDGYNVSQSGVLAAIGTKQLERADEILAKRRILGRRYVEEIGAWECTEYWYQPFLTANADERERLVKFLEEKGIATRSFFNPLHRQPAFPKTAQRLIKEFPVSKDLYDRGVLLPLYSQMTREEQDYVINKVKEFYGRI